MLELTTNKTFIWIWNTVLTTTYRCVWANLRGPEEIGESLNPAWSQEHQNFEHEDWNVKEWLVTSTSYKRPTVVLRTCQHDGGLSGVCDLPKGRWRPVVTICTNRALSKKLPVSFSGSKWPLGGLDSQGLSGFTDNFCTRLPQSVAPWNEWAANLMFSLHRGHLGLCDICQDSLQMTSVVWSHYASGYRVSHRWEI